jgi:hypothetical protein
MDDFYESRQAVYDLINLAVVVGFVALLFALAFWYTAASARRRQEHEWMRQQYLWASQARPPAHPPPVQPKPPWPTIIDDT